MVIVSRRTFNKKVFIPTSCTWLYEFFSGLSTLLNEPPSHPSSEEKQQGDWGHLIKLDYK